MFFRKCFVTLPSFLLVHENPQLFYISAWLSVKGLSKLLCMRITRPVETKIRMRGTLVKLAWMRENVSTRESPHNARLAGMLLLHGWQVCYYLAFKLHTSYLLSKLLSCMPNGRSVKTALFQLTTPCKDRLSRREGTKIALIAHVSSATWHPVPTTGRPECSVCRIKKENRWLVNLPWK